MADTLNALHNGEFDIVLLDVLLQSENGLDILKKIKEDDRLKNIPVAMFTNYTKQETQDEAMAFGAVDYIVKIDLTLEQLVKRVKAIASDIS